VATNKKKTNKTRKRGGSKAGIETSPDPSSDNGGVDWKETKGASPTGSAKLYQPAE